MIIDGIKIKGITSDSRIVKKDYVFVALNGEKEDGNEFIDEAVKNGASIVYTENNIYRKDCIPKQIEDGRKKLADLCNEFYDYRAKYIDDRSELVIPVELKPAVEGLIKTYSVKAFQAVEASGLARVDFFLSRDGSTVTINEINTLPGFTSISMYPKMWEASGVSYDKLVNRLLELAEVRHFRRSSLLAAPPE